MGIDLNGPAVLPPPGIVSNFDNPSNANKLAWAVYVICGAVSTACLLLRGYGRVYLLHKIQIEEVLLVIAYGNFWGSLWGAGSMIKTPGYLVHSWDVRLGDTIPMTYFIFIFGTCYSVVLPCLKCAILIEWCRMFVPRGNRVRNPFFWGCVTVMFVQITANIAIITALNLQCTPYNAIWDITVPGRKCFDLFKLQVSSATIHLVSDFAILLLPQHVIWTLNMTWQKRLGVSVVFGLGLLACVSAAFRLATTVAYGVSPDPLFKIGDLIFWATAEMTCGFFIACVPCIPKILKDSRLLMGLRRGLGLVSTSIGAQSVTKSNVFSAAAGTRATHDHSATMSSSNAYYKLDEEGVPMDNLKPIESSEQLRNVSVSVSVSGSGSNSGSGGGGGSGNGGGSHARADHSSLGITRTTQITVTQDAAADKANASAGSPMGLQGA